MDLKVIKATLVLFVLCNFFAKRRGDLIETVASKRLIKIFIHYYLIMFD